MPDSIYAPAVPTEKPQTKKKRHWLAWLIVALICVALLLPLLHKSAPMGAMGPGGGPGGPGAPPGGPSGGPFGSSGATSVTVATVKSGDMQIFVDALGTVTPQTTVNVYSQMSGRVMSVNYREGQMVHKGQILAEIDPRPTEAQQQQAQGTLMRDRALLDQARTNLKRYQDAIKEHAISEQTLSDQQATVQQYEGSVTNDEGSIRYYEVQLGYCHIVAPVSGRIGLRLIDAGNTIFSGSSSTIATITQLDPITVVFSVAEDHLREIEKQLHVSREGLLVDVYDRSQSTKLATGKLLTIDNQVDTSTGTVKLRALFHNADGTLFPNQFVNARLQVSTLKNANLIPTAAAQYNGQQAFVYTVSSDNIASLHNVSVVNTEGSETAVDGLKPGDTIVTSNFDRLQDGAKVAIGMPAMGGPAGSQQGAGPGSGAMPTGAPPSGGRTSGMPPSGAPPAGISAQQPNSQNGTAPSAATAGPKK